MPPPSEGPIWTVPRKLSSSAGGAVRSGSSASTMAGVEPGAAMTSIR
jgi:hypothetical protein